MELHMSNSPIKPNSLQIIDETEAQITTTVVYAMRTSKGLIVPILKRQQGEYVSYSPKTRTKYISIYAIENRPTKKAAHLSKTLGRKVNESTARSIR